MRARPSQALAALLSAFDLPPLLLPQARWGLALVEGGSGRSKLGGRPQLDPDWPVHEDHPLTHLASIALGEPPPFPGRDRRCRHDLTGFRGLVA